MVNLGLLYHRFNYDGFGLEFKQPSYCYCCITVVIAINWHGSLN